MLPMSIVSNNINSMWMKMYVIIMPKTKKKVRYVTQGYKCQDWDLNPHSSDQKHQSLFLKCLIPFCYGQVFGHDMNPHSLWMKIILMSHPKDKATLFINFWEKEKRKSQSSFFQESRVIPLLMLKTCSSPHRDGKIGQVVVNFVLPSSPIQHLSK